MAFGRLSAKKGTTRSTGHHMHDTVYIDTADFQTANDMKYK